MCSFQFPSLFQTSACKPQSLLTSSLEFRFARLPVSQPPRRVVSLHQIKVRALRCWVGGPKGKSPSKTSPSSAIFIFSGSFRGTNGNWFFLKAPWHRERSWGALLSAHSSCVCLVDYMCEPRWLPLLFVTPDREGGRRRAGEANYSKSVTTRAKV